MNPGASIAAFKAWLAKPFSPDMSAQQWFLFFGLLLVISFMWHLVLRLMSSTVSAVADS
jgi:hypothetical protein